MVFPIFSSFINNYISMLTNVSKSLLIFIFLFASRTNFAQAQSHSANPDRIPGHFIVTVDASEDPETVAQDHGIEPKYIFHHAINGFAGSASELAHAGLMGDPRVR